MSNASIQGHELSVPPPAVRSQVIPKQKAESGYFSLGLKIILGSDLCHVHEYPPAVKKI